MFEEVLNTESSYTTPFEGNIMTTVNPSEMITLAFSQLSNGTEFLAPSMGAQRFIKISQPEINEGGELEVNALSRGNDNYQAFSFTGTELCHPTGNHFEFASSDDESEEQSTN
ncbi:hypothetical protein [Citrobacter portucalensis]|uniref:hypothetical protein n=1 Tax=Citrobacter portucalensis TaxID=1639133 RepID=UPI003CECD9DC